MIHCLTWGVKESLMRYVRGLADGLIEVSGGAAMIEPGEAEMTEPGAFRFPFVEAATDGGGVLRYGGRLHWYGHGGLMDAALSDPWLSLGPAPTISFEVELPDMPVERWTIATMKATEASEGLWEGTEVRLTVDGALTLGALQYHEYQQVDDLSFSAPRA